MSGNPREVILKFTRRVVRRASRAVATPPFPYRDAVKNGFALLPDETRQGFDKLLARLDGFDFRGWYDPQEVPQATDFATWFREANYRWDGCGVVRVMYESGEHYNPLTIGSQAFLSLSTALATTGEARADALQTFLSLAHFLETTAVRRERFVTWQYYFPFRDISRAWNSCLSQAVLLDTWGKCYELTGDDQYRRLMESTFAALLVPTEAGGLALVDSRGRPWLEEYTGTSELKHVLNGFISAALIVWNNRQRLGKLFPAALWQSWLETIREAIVEYTSADQIRYSALGGPTPEHYFPQMARQLELLHQITGDGLLLDYADRWREIHRRRSGIRLWWPAHRAA